MWVSVQFNSVQSPRLKDPTPLTSGFLASVSFSAGQMGSKIEDNLY